MTNIQEYERSVLTAIMQDNELMRDVKQLLTPDDFTLEFHRKTFLYMLRLHDSNRPIDPITIFTEVQQQREEKAVPASRLSDLLTGESVKHAGHYCRTVRDESQKRRIRTLLRQAADCEEGSAPEMCARLISDLAEFQEQPTFGTSGEMFVSADRFCSTIPEKIDWMIDKIIPRGANGIIAGVPKVSKSVLAADMAVALAVGEPFLGFDIPRPVKVALISREDHPGLTGWRLRAFRNSRGLSSLPNLIVNTRQQLDILMIDDAGQVAQMIEQLKRHRVEFAILDVFNRLHSKDENDAQEMTEVMGKLTKIQSQVRCGMALIHHYNKTKDGNWTERLRGSSAISGWVEWLIGVTLEGDAEKTRKVEFELKADEAPKPVWYQIQSDSVEKTMHLRITDDPSLMGREEKSKREPRLV